MFGKPPRGRRRWVSMLLEVHMQAAARTDAEENEVESAIAILKRGFPALLDVFKDGAIPLDEVRLAILDVGLNLRVLVEHRRVAKEKCDRRALLCTPLSAPQPNVLTG